MFTFHVSETENDEWYKIHKNNIFPQNIMQSVNNATKILLYLL